MAARADEEQEMHDDKAEKDVATDETEGTSLPSVSSWLSGWYDSAKKKIAETNEFMKRDLQEFSQAVHSDASKLVAATATTMKEKLHINVDMEDASATTRNVTNSLSNFLGNIAHKVGPIRPGDDENEEESAIMGTSTGTKVLSPAEARIYAIRTDPATFCNEPDSEGEYFSWLPSFNVEDKKTEISTLMVDCSQIRSLYTKLVPSAVSHSDFWGRYFFKLHQHNKAEEKRAMLMERAHKTHDDIEWDDEDDEWVQPKNIPSEIPSSVENQKEESYEPVKAADTESESPSTDTTELNKLVEKKPIQSVGEIVPNQQHETQVAAHNVITPDKGNQDKEHSDKQVELVPKENKMKDNVVELEEASSVVENVNSNGDKKEPSKDDTSRTKTSSCGESSDDWEKDFDLDMTEDEIQEALKESDAIDVNVDDIGDDWDEWE